MSSTTRNSGRRNVTNVKALISWLELCFHFLFPFFSLSLRGNHLYFFSLLLEVEAKNRATSDRIRTAFFIVVFRKQPVEDDDAVGEEEKNDSYMRGFPVSPRQAGYFRLCTSLLMSRRRKRDRKEDSLVIHEPESLHQLCTFIRCMARKEKHVPRLDFPRESHKERRVNTEGCVCMSNPSVVWRIRWMRKAKHVV